MAYAQHDRSSRRAVVSLTGVSRTLAVALSLIVACSGSGETTTNGDAGPGSGGGDDTTDGDVELPSAADECVNAPTVGPGRWSGALPPSDKSQGACGLGGPDAFFRVEIPRRVDLWVRAEAQDFVPRLAVTPDVCHGEAQLTCNLDGADAEGTWLFDLLGGSAVHIVVGADPETPALEQMKPLPFSVEIDLRRVLEAGETCMPEALGRCVAGTVCAPADASETGGGDETWACLAVDADTCADAEVVDFAGAERVLELSGPPLQSDAHHHSCSGEGLVERVYYVRAAEPITAGESLQISASSPEVGLAVRGPGCELEDERACAAPGDTLAGVDLTSVAGALYLFVEWPVEPEASLDALTVTLKRLTG